MSFTRYSSNDSVISSETVVRPLWSGDVSTLTTFVTSSTQTTASMYYFWDIYSSTSPTASVQFDIQFGHISGSGSIVINPDPSLSSYSTSKVIYGQYRNLIYGAENAISSSILDHAGNNMGSGSIFVINIARSCYKEALKPGSLTLILSSSLVLTDDSQTNNTTNFIGSNIYYNLVSGSNGTVNNTSKYYGYVFPNLGFMILDPNAIDGAMAPYNTATASITDPGNPGVLLDAISFGSNFTLQSQETVSSRYFFTRVINTDYNYTTNPSVIDNNGNLIFTDLINNPQTFVTTVGLYNDNNELLAVAKLSKPLVKDFTKESLLRIKLNY